MCDFESFDIDDYFDVRDFYFEMNYEKLCTALNKRGIKVRKYKSVEVKAG